MNKRTFFSIAGAAALVFSATSNLSAAELLLNGSFESPIQTTNGDHTSVAADSWTAAANSYTNTNVLGDCNIVRGPVTGTGAATTITPIVGSQSFDGVGGNVFVSQSFTLTTASALHVQAYIGGRDSTSATGAGSFFQLGTVTTTLGVPSGFNALYTSNTVNPATGTWSLVQLNTAVLAPGTYRFTVSLGDPDHLDRASITNVPEPTTLAAAGLGPAFCAAAPFQTHDDPSPLSSRAAPLPRYRGGGASAGSA